MRHPGHKLNNRHKYALQRSLNIALGIFCSVAGVFIPKKRHIVLTSSLNTEFTDNSRALFEFLYEDPELRPRLYFVINDRTKRDALNARYPGRFISNRDMKGLFIALSARYWFASWLEFPAPGFFNRHVRTVYHLGHGMPYKKAGLLETRVTWYKRLYYGLVTSNISYTVATSDLFKPKIARIFGLDPNRVLMRPQPKTGQIAHPEPAPAALVSGTGTHILYAPTWRPSTDVELFPFADLDTSALSDFLVREDIHIWLRPHPRFHQDGLSALLSLPHVALFPASDYPEINSYLSYFGALITDYSSVYYDFLYLNRPILRLDYDLEAYQRDVGVIREYDEIKPPVAVGSMHQLTVQLLRIKNAKFDISPLRATHERVNFPIAVEDIRDFFIQKAKSELR